MKKKINYINQGRGGTVLFTEGPSVIPFYFEFGGGNCVAIIFVPTPEEWENSTRRPLPDREPVLRFIAEQVINDQAPGCTYTLTDNAIEIFTR